MPSPSDIHASSLVVAAICGCWYRESYVNPGIWESLIVCPWDYMHTTDPYAGGFGFGQWTNTGSGAGMRCLNLHNWVTANGYADGDGAGQIAYLLYENIWYNDSHQRGSYRTLEQFLNSDSTNLTDLTWDFLASWEGVPGDAFSIRIENAQRFLAYIQEHANDNPSDFMPAISANRALSWDETLHNVMFVYFALNGHLSPGGGEITEDQFLMLAILGKKRRRRQNYGKSRIRI